MTTAPDSTNFRTRLGRLLASTRRRALLFGLARSVTVGAGALLLAAWAVGAEARPGAVVNWGLSLSLLAVLVLAVRDFLVRPLKPWRSLRDLVRNIESKHASANLLVAAEEAERLPERWAGDEPVITELRRRLYLRAEAILTAMTPERVLELPQVRAWVLGLAAVFCLGLLMAVGAREDLGRGLSRLARPWPEKFIIATGGLYAASGPEFVVAGQDVQLMARDFAGGVDDAVCEVRIGSGLWQPLETSAEPVLEGTIGLPTPYRSWQAQVSRVREDFAWRFVRGSMVTDAGQVTVRHHPLVTGLAARVSPPAYTRLSARDLGRVPTWFEVPAGSELRLSGTVNHPVERARLVTQAGDTLALATDSEGFSGSMRVTKSRVFTIVLEDSYGLRNQSPLPYEVAVVADAEPAVSLRREEDDGILPISGLLALEVESADDYGLAGLDLLVRTRPRTQEPGADHSETGWRGGRIWPDSGRDWVTLDTAAGPLRVRTAADQTGSPVLRIRLGLELEAGDLDLVAGDALEFVVEARDNKEPGPPGISRSHILRLVLPSAADVLASQAEASEERRSELEEMQNRSRELDADLDRLTRELMKNPLPDWTRQQEMEKAIDRQKTLQDELARVAGELQEELDRMAASQLTSEAQQEKADEVSELLSQSGSERLNDLLDKMDEASGQVSPQDVARAMEEVARNQKEMARRLDAALAMLKRMAQEQELEGITALLEKMIQKQQELAELSRQLEKEQEAAAQEGDEGGEGEQSEEDKESEQGEKGEQSDQENEGSGDQENQEGSQSESDKSEQSSEAGETPDAEELARRQEALAEELEQLTEKLEEALEKLREEKAENPDSASQDQMEAALEEALEKLEQQQSESKMNEASEQLMQMDPGEAAQMQEQALRDLGALYHVMIQSQEAMQMAMKMEQVSSLRGLAADMLALSTRQEEIAGLIPADLRDLRTLELTRAQHRVQKATIVVRDNLAELMDEAPNRIMKLLKKLDDLIEEMGRSLRGMEENRAQIARHHARQSLAASNRMVISLLTEAQMSGGGSSSSSNPMDSMSEQLKQMAKEQAGLNGATEELRKMLADRGMSQQLRSEMKRLGEEQAGLAGRMNELAEEDRQKERPEGERVLGDIGQMGLDMESIGDDLEEGLVSEETLRRQERILSRMLDARNSVRRRDYSNRRESKTASGLFERQAGRDGAQDDVDDQRFRLRYQPLEKAPLEYRELVRRYFTALDSLRRLDDLPPGDRELP